MNFMHFTAESLFKTLPIAFGTWMLIIVSGQAITFSDLQKEGSTAHTHDSQSFLHKYMCMNISTYVHSLMTSYHMPCTYSRLHTLLDM